VLNTKVKRWQFRSQTKRNQAEAAAVVALSLVEAVEIVIEAALAVAIEVVLAVETEVVLAVAEIAQEEVVHLKDKFFTVTLYGN
jgi:hypothetical protein